MGNKKYQLICNSTDFNSFKPIMDKDTNGNKKWYIQGLTMQVGVNSNNYNYVQSVLESSILDYKKNFFDKNRAVGELGHPDDKTREIDSINWDYVSHKFVEMNFDGKDLITKSLILDDMPKGKIASTLLNNEITLGLSSRNLAILEERKDGSGIQDVTSQHIVTPGDIVHDPAVTGAIVEAIRNKKQWIWDNGDFVGLDLEEKIDKYNKALDNVSYNSIRKTVRNIVDDYFDTLF